MEYVKELFSQKRPRTARQKEYILESDLYPVRVRPIILDIAFYLLLLNVIVVGSIAVYYEDGQMMVLALVLMFIFFGVMIIKNK